MAAPKGNQYWKFREHHGSYKKYTPEELWIMAIEYFQWVEGHPLQEEKVFCNQGVVTRTTVPHMRAMTEGAFCIYADMDFTTWYEYKKIDDYSQVTTRIVEMIRSQKFEGAAAEFLNANIIARDLGLKDKTELSGELKNAVQVYLPDNGRGKTTD